MSVRMELSALASSKTLVRRPAKELLHGCVAISTSRDGWVRPQRLTQGQIRAVGSVLAWHPGLYRTMAQTTAGVTVEFTTDSSEIALEVSLDPEPAGTRSELKYVPDEVAFVDGGEGRIQTHDGFGLEVDGKILDPVMPKVGKGAFSFWVDDPRKSPADGIGQLPGMGDTHHVRVWLPCLRGCALRSVVGNGTMIEPVPQRRQLLVLGDSIAQGFVCGDPSQSWPAQLARKMGLDLLNQSIGGQVFQPGTFSGLREVTDVSHIIVALGANYRYERCQERLVRRDLTQYFSQLDSLWPDTTTYVLDPLWHNEEAYPSHAGSCWHQLPAMIADVSGRYGQMHLVDGMRLLDHKAKYLSDGYEHPSPEGMRQVAQRMKILITHRERSQEDLRVIAEGALKKAPRRCIPLREMVRRGIGTIEYASKDCVLLRTPDGIQTFWSSDQDLGRSVIVTLLSSSVIVCLEPVLVREIQQACSLPDLRPYHLCYLDESTPKAKTKGGSKSKKSAGADVPRDIRPLDQAFFAQVRAGYADQGMASDEEIRGLLDGGGILGGFEDGELVGFVGEHPCGSIGMLYVLPDHRGRGWGRSLLEAKVKDHQARGWMPWSEVYEDNKVSLRLHRSLGMKVTPANEQCYLSAATRSE